jgi:hypothetical protein
MKNSMFLLITAGVLMLTSCSSTPTKVDTGSIRASTFNFVDRSSPNRFEFADNDAAINAAVQQAITENLSRHGVSRVAGIGDLTVAYLITVSDNVSTTAINEYFGYGRNPAALVDKAHEKLSVESNNPNNFAAGTLLIDILDSKTYELLKRSFVVRPVYRNVSADARAARIQEAVYAVLSNLKITH